MHFALKELRKIISIAISEDSKILYGPSHAKEFVDSLLPSESTTFDDRSEKLATAPTHIIMLSLTDEMEDIYSELTRMRNCIDSSTRICVVTINKMWSGIRNRVYGLSGGSRINNWIPPSEITNLFEQTGFEIVQQRNAVIIPFRIPFLSHIANRWLSQMPVLRHFSVFNIVTIRPKLRVSSTDSKVSIIVAARNEAGNIQSLIDRLPMLSPIQELIFVEGGSDDSTWETIQVAISQNQELTSRTISA